MTRASSARRLATAAAYGGGGLGALGGALYGLMRAQAVWARRTIGRAIGQGPQVDRRYGTTLPGEPLSVLVLGDSAAAGYGLQTADDTPAGLLGSGLSHIVDRPVHVLSVARVGARSADLDAQIDRGIHVRPQLAVLVVGANDVTHSVPPAQAVRALDAAVRRLRAEGAAVVVGTCPDLGTIRPVPYPLRLLARAWSRRLAAAQTIAVVEAGARAVSLGALLGPSFDAAPSELFGPDLFHPSAAGYASMVAALLPSVAAAADAWDEEDPSGRPGDVVLPISFAAAEAVRVPGTESSGTEVAGRERGAQGRWVRIRQRVRRPVPATTTSG